MKFRDEAVDVSGVDRPVRQHVAQELPFAEPVMTHSSPLSANDIAYRPELATFCEWLAVHVATGDGRDELTLATASVVRLAREMHLEAVTVVDAVELIGCPPLHVHDASSRTRGDRYANALAWLVRGLFGGG